MREQLSRRDRGHGGITDGPSGFSFFFLDLATVVFGPILLQPDRLNDSLIYYAGLFALDNICTHASCFYYTVVAFFTLTYYQISLLLRHVQGHPECVCVCACGPDETVLPRKTTASVVSADTLTNVYVQVTNPLWRLQ